MAFQGKEPRFTSAILTDALSSLLSSPISGSRKLLNRYGRLFFLDSNGVETQAEGGTPEKNYINSPSSSIGWTASGAGITLADDTTAADLPRAKTTGVGILITGVSGSTAYIYRRFTLDATDYGTLQKIKADFSALSGYTDSDFKIDLYKNTASNYGGTSTRVALSTDSASISAIPNATQVFQCTFSAPTSAAPYMELRIGLNAAATSSLVMSDVIVGPGIVPAATTSVAGLVLLKAPTQQIFTSGSGTYTTPASVLWIRVRMVGGGGGGSGSGTIGAGNGGNGGDTTFGSSLLTASKGVGGQFNSSGGSSGGAYTINSPAIGFGMTGSAAGSSSYSNPASGSNGSLGSDGGSSFFGGAGRAGGGSDALGSAAQANTGSGGGGGGFSNPGSGAVGGSGGAAGGYIDAIISSPSATYSYAVGAAGAAGTVGTSGHVGYAGGSGIIIVEEHYS